ncbi:MAG: class I SAM-dependent DNA methyltransferase, partial [Azonexus sp.]|nr:class I SAM-dependent DNA methyltransferase [Azonexus sp.]
RRNGYPHALNPILKPLDGIEHRDALLNPDGSEAEWPAADVIVGNPPFLGDKVMRSELGASYVETLRKTYDRRVPGGADLVTYWFEKARAQIEAGKLQGAGLVATQSIRAGANRKVLERIVATTSIFEAWSDEEWVNDGAAVRVSLVGFGPICPLTRSSRLNSLEVASIFADLSAVEGVNLTTAIPLPENRSVAFQGPVKVGAFDIPGPQARQWLTIPNPNRRPNTEVLRPWANGQDLAKRPSDTWIIDFGVDMPETDAVLYEMPINHVIKHVKPMREAGNRESRKRYWWRHGETVPAYRKATQALTRYISTPRVAKHRYFVWLPTSVLPDSRLYAICRDDDATFGILSSRQHEVWSLANASMHGVGNDPTYNAKSCFETFPFPAGMTPRDTAPKAGQATPPCMAGDILAENIAAAARRLNELREAWLNPPEWVDWVITPEEEKAGFPKRPVAKPGHEADLKKRTLTNLYNARPAWLDMAHKALDQAVAAAYDWPDYSADMPDEEILRRLLALNLERAAG